MSRVRVFVAFGVALLLAACGESGTSGSPTPTASPSPSTSPSPSPSPSVSPTPSPSPTGRFSSIEDAVAFIDTKVAVPVLLPDPLPEGTQLAERHPVEIAKYPGGPTTAALNLVYGDDGELRIEYGAPTFGDCEGHYDSIDEVKVNDDPAILAVSSDNSTVLWPATFKRIQGKYKISGTFTGEEILALAESMQPLPSLEPEKPPPAC